MLDQRLDGEEVDKHIQTPAGCFFKWDDRINKLFITKLFEELKAVHNPEHSKETIAGKLLSAIVDNQKL